MPCRTPQYHSNVRLHVKYPPAPTSVRMSTPSIEARGATHHRPPPRNHMPMKKKWRSSPVRNLAQICVSPCKQSRSRARMHQVGEPLAGTERSIMACAMPGKSAGDLIIAAKDTHTERDSQDLARTASQISMIKKKVLRLEDGTCRPTVTESW